MPSYPFRSALVTGASSGIGEAIARRLARDGVAVTLVARRRDRLDALAAQLTGSSVLVADLADQAGRNIVAARLAATDVDLLVNNAGFGVGMGLLDAEPARLAQQLAVNVTAVVELTQAAAQAMAARRRGWILNVSSLAGELPTPSDSGYGASKAYVTSFTEGVAAELAPFGVWATAVLPGYTRTEFHRVSGTDPADVPGWAWLTADHVAEAGLAGAAAGKVICIPGRKYQIVTELTRHLPRSLIRRVASNGIRSR